jgi:hypothetical protein
MYPGDVDDAQTVRHERGVAAIVVGGPGGGLAPAEAPPLEHSLWPHRTVFHDLVLTPRIGRYRL